jgi:hypothetical protein
MNNDANTMQENLDTVWNERDPARRLKAIKRIYSETATLNHVEDQVTGHDAINASVTATQHMLPANFVFTSLRPVIINNSIGRLIWGAGPLGQPSAATGMDIAHFENGKIKSLYVFLEDQ